MVRAAGVEPGVTSASAFANCGISFAAVGLMTQARLRGSERCYRVREARVSGIVRKRSASLGGQPLAPAGSNGSAVASVPCRGRTAVQARAGTTDAQPPPGTTGRPDCQRPVVVQKNTPVTS